MTTTIAAQPVTGQDINVAAQGGPQTPRRTAGRGRHVVPSAGDVEHTCRARRIRAT